MQPESQGETLEYQILEPNSSHLCTTCCGVTMSDIAHLVAEIKTRFAQDPLRYLQVWIPEGRMEGGSYRADCLSGGKGRSLRIEIKDGKEGVGFDHATGECVGGPIDIFAAVHGYECRGESFRRLVERMAGEMGISEPLKTNSHATIYHYQTKAGAPWCEVHRSAGKVIRPFDPATGKYGKPAFPTKAPLYRLQEIMSADAVLVVEGEKCVEAARAAGLVATTSIGGTNAFAKTDWSPLAGKNVTIWPDNDGPGKKYADAVAQLVTELGAANVCLVSLPEDAPDKWDIADAVDQSLDIEALLKNVRSYAEEWPAVFWVADFEGTEPPVRQFIIDQWLPRGHVTSLYGKGGSGKSLIAQQMASCVASGEPFFGCLVDSGPVVAIFTEDVKDEFHRRQKDICRKLIIPYGKANMCCICLGMRPDDEPDMQMISFPSNAKPNVEWSMTSDIEFLCKKLRPKLLVLDNIAQLFGGNENDRAHVTYWLNRLNALAQTYDMSVLLLGHFRKGSDEFSGSTAWEAGVRALVTLSRIDEENHESPLSLCLEKSNYAKRQSMIVKWVEGAFQIHRPENGPAQEVPEAHKELFLAALDQLAAIKADRLSNAHRSPYYAPRVIKDKGLCPDMKISQITAAMDRLFGDGAIEIAQIDYINHNQIWGIVRTSSLVATSNGAGVEGE